MNFIIPNNVNLSRIRGLIKLIKQNNGSMLISELSDQSEEEIDDLIPIINMCKFLNLIKIKKDEIQLNELGKKLNYKDYINLVKERIREAEPIKSVLEFLNNNIKSTDEIIADLNKKEIKIYNEEKKSELKKILIDWAVRTKLIAYNTQKDEWHIINYEK